MRNPKQPLRLVALATALGLAAASCAKAPSAPAPLTGGPPTGTPSADRHVQVWPFSTTVVGTGPPATGTIPNGVPTTSGCYQLTSERVIFKVFWVDSDNRSDWDAQANAVKSECKGTRSWNNKWYYYTLPDDRTHNLMLLWMNIDEDKYGYLVIKNTPTLWLVYSNDGGPWTPQNGALIRRTWSSDGEKISFGVYNPNNTGGWTANDIWVSLGY